MFNRIDAAEKLYISIEMNGVAVSHFTAAPEYYYDEDKDCLAIGEMDGENWIELDCFKKNYTVSYDKEYDDYSIKSADCEVVIEF